MYTTRVALKEELPQLVQFWTKMTIEMSEVEATPLPSAERIEEIKEIFESRYDSGELMFRVAVNEQNQIIACAGGLVRLDYPWPLSKQTEKVGWVVSVYTDIDHRKQGLAYRIVQEVCEWLQSQEVMTIRLWASQQGKPTYEKLGFYTMSFMEKDVYTK